MKVAGVSAKPVRQLFPVKRLSDFKANPRNPRKISDQQLADLRKAMVEFGDLSGLVVNRETGNMIGGHQRVKILGELPVTVLRRFDPPTARGTVAEGFVEYQGERFIYREVRWTLRTEQAAMLAANKHGGDWDLDLVADLLGELRNEELDMALTGFGESELSRLLGDLTAGSTGPRSDESDDMRIVQLMFTVKTLPKFLEHVQILEQRFGTDDITATVTEAVERCHRDSLKVQS